MKGNFQSKGKKSQVYWWGLFIHFLSFLHWWLAIPWHVGISNTPLLCYCGDRRHIEHHQRHTRVEALPQEPDGVEKVEKAWKLMFNTLLHQKEHSWYYSCQTRDAILCLLGAGKDSHQLVWPLVTVVRHDVPDCQGPHFPGLLTRELYPQEVLAKGAVLSEQGAPPYDTPQGCLQLGPHSVQRISDLNYFLLR